VPEVWAGEEAVQITHRIANHQSQAREAKRLYTRFYSYHSRFVHFPTSCLSELINDQDEIEFKLTGYPSGQYHWKNSDIPNVIAALDKASLVFCVTVHQSGLLWQQLDLDLRQKLESMKVTLAPAYPAGDDFHHLSWHIIYPRSNQPASSRQFKPSDLVAWEFDHSHLMTISQKVKNPVDPTTPMLFIGKSSHVLFYEPHPQCCSPSPKLGPFAGTADRI
jgi:hypothetical protein